MRTRFDKNRHQHVEYIQNRSNVDKQSVDIAAVLYVYCSNAVYIANAMRTLQRVRIAVQCERVLLMHRNAFALIHRTDLYLLLTI